MDTLKKLHRFGVLILFAVAFSPFSAQAEEVPARGPIPFAAYDKDEDGLIIEDEFYSAHQERGTIDAPSFSAFDADDDGQLTPEELAAGQRAQMEKRGGMGMGAGRGRGMGLGMGGEMPDFSEYDLNGDGKIVENEFNEARGQRISERAQQGYQMRNLGEAPSFSDIDTDDNGEISPEEFDAHQIKHLQQKME